MHPELLDCFEPTRGLCHQFHIWLAAQKTDDPLEENRMIVDRQNSDRVGNGIHNFISAIAWTRKNRADCAVLSKRSRPELSIRLQYRYRAGSRPRKYPR